MVSVSVSILTVSVSVSVSILTVSVSVSVSNVKSQPLQHLAFDTYMQS